MYTPNTAHPKLRSNYSRTRISRLGGLGKLLAATVALSIAVGFSTTGGGTPRLKSAAPVEKKASVTPQLTTPNLKWNRSVKSFLTASTAAAPALNFCDVPTTLPRGTPLLSYSPVVCIDYSGLAQQVYTLKAWLLGGPDQVHPNCGSTQWCERTFTIDNSSGQNSAGRVLVVQNMDVHNIELFYWLLRLYDQGLNEVAPFVQQPVSWTTNRAPVLNSIGNKTVSPGQSLDFTVSASDTEGNAVSFTALNLPPGATLNSNTGQFHWQPTTPGTYSSIGFVATQTGGTPLSDAELITIQVENTSSANVLAFSAASFTTGEAGPASLTITRTNSSAGSVGVTYSTANGTANSGSDFTGAATTVTFVNGETAKVIRVPTVNDAGVEANETFQVALSAPTGGATIGGPSQATVTIVDDDTPQLAGQWGSVITFPTVPIHMHLLPTGKVMFWDRHNHNATPMWDVTPRLWDPASPTEFTTVPLPGGGDIFCSGHTLMADGRVFVAGGHIADFAGTSTAEIYNPFTGSWTTLPNMNAGRWYPSTTTLPNGDVLVLAGTRVNYADINPLPQVFQTSTNTWRNLSSATLGAYPAWADYYPYTFVAPNGKVFVAGPQRTARYLDTAGTGAWTDVANSSLCYRDYGSSVMYDDGKVLIVGGNPRNDCDPAIPLPILPSATAEVINLNAPTPAWRTVAPMSVGRRHLNTTILPDGKVLVTGGTSAPGHDDPVGGVFFAELWDPNTEQWTTLSGHNRYRGYHSVAVLLPDGRVLIGGGGHPDPSGGSAENNAEIYSPPYLFKGARPAITTAPTVVTYGQTFSVQTSDAANISNVNLIRLSSVTHAFNESQRINRLNFSKTVNNLNVTAPANANLCPPGYYMLFILDGNGVPSVAKIVQIVDSAPPSTSGDFDGDGKADLAVWRPSSGVWFIVNSTGGQRIQAWGTNGDFPAPGDYDGDRKTDLAIYHPATGEWQILNSSNGSTRIQGWGLSDDVPVPGDYDGDGRADIAVWRPTTGQWFILNSSDGQARIQGWGANGDIPMPGSYDGDTKTDLTVWRPATGQWFIVNSSNGQARIQGWGTGGDVPEGADYDGDVKADLAVWRPSSGTWYIINSLNNSTRVQGWGANGDIPVASDYDGDGKRDLAVWRPASGTWYINNSQNNSTRVQGWGSLGDVPVSGVLIIR